MHRLRISVSEILGQPGRYRDLVIEEPLPEVATALARIDPQHVHGELRLESVVEGILVSGRVGTPMTLECARCLEEFSAPLRVEVCELYYGPRHQGPVEDDGYRVEEDEIDLEPMLRDALALELPLNPLCRADCRGYCPGCGADLNAGACDCTDDDIDPRWAELAGLRDKLA